MTNAVYFRTTILSYWGIIRRKHSSKFTLIELLVVIGIIAILMTILLPALKKAKDRGKSIVCAGQLKQFGTAFTNYSCDFDSWFPVTSYVYQSPSTNGLKKQWDMMISGYVGYSYPGGPAIFHCPSSTSTYAPAVATSRGYAMNKYFTKPDAGTKVDIANLARNPSPSKLGTLLEIHKENLVGGHEGNSMYQSYYYQFDYTDAFKHSNGMNVLFADGHVGWHKVRYSNYLYVGQPGDVVFSWYDDGSQLSP